MDDCIFCKIADKKIPANIIYEDNNFLAMLDIRPLSPGHSLIIPKKHFRFVWDVPNAGEYFEIAKKIALAQKKAFDTEYIFSKIVGEEIPHAHIWVFPEDKVNERMDKKDFENIAELLKRSIS